MMTNPDQPRSAVPSLLIAAVLLLAILAGGVPYVREEPGDTFDALGRVGNQQLVKIALDRQYPQYPTTGQLRILTVFEWGGPLGALQFGDAIRASVDRGIVLQPVEFLYPTETDSSQLQQEGAFQFEDARSQAIAAALRKLDIPVVSQVSVAEVDPKGPAAKVLRTGDILRAIAGQPFTDFVGLDTQLATFAPGDRVTLSITRAGKSIEKQVTLGKNAKGKARIGIMIRIDFAGPMAIDIQLNNVGGPSAGLAFALSIYDRLSPGALLRGRVVAVTGTIDENGQVGPIGGLHQKLAAAARSGAQLMLIPAENCADIDRDVPNGLRVVPVRTLDAAISALNERSLAALPVCEVAH